jgi:hypothetical protein
VQELLVWEEKSELGKSLPLKRGVCRGVCREGLEEDERVRHENYGDG